MEKDNYRKCIECNESAIPPEVPWGKWKCKECRKKDGRCYICGVNRNDCCC